MSKRHLQQFSDVFGEESRGEERRGEEGKAGGRVTPKQEAPHLQPVKKTASHRATASKRHGTPRPPGPPLAPAPLLSNVTAE
ncbi:hypothetical protein AAFF_G00279060 [Aldrovandia affinis]|uniref:Uncharacterized protein n=1 Tax=Aldrovandia affinis TaxID=143900 RepID=A0AAD7SSF3_9TELE|nr:hypothetical protein AAFF_G00279060 [Aldrovandia affinis]